MNARPKPYRAPELTARGHNNKAASLGARSQLRAPFSLEPSLPFTVTLSGKAVSLEGRPAAPRFRDGLGYYPGLEFVSPGPRDTGDRWMTKRWNTGVVIPSRIPYGVRGAGHRAGNDFLLTARPTPRRVSGGAQPGI